MCTKKLLFATVAMATVLVPHSGAQTSAADRCSETDKVRMPGAYLKWIEIAEPIFRQKHLNLEKYNIVIDDDKDSIIVELRSTDATCEGFGSTGSRPDFAVEIRKSDEKILKYYFEK
ncbi:MAG: hypothetical protein ABSA85_03540 [Terracidiphilus sp.]|jgi:hypothetical protein